MGFGGLKAMQGFSRQIGAFRKDRSGNILISAAFAFPLLLGVGGLVLEYGGGLLDDARNQRVADMASYAGAIAYVESKSETRMSQAAKSVAALNGVPASAVTASLVDSPKSSGAKAVSVEIRTDRELFLTKLLNPRDTLRVHAAAMAETGGGQATPGCVLALDSGQTGVTLSGGTELRAADCSVSSNNTITVPCGTYIKAIGVNYNSAAVPTQPCKGITNKDGGATIIAKQATADPLAGHAGIAAAFKRFEDFSTLANITAPAAPATVTGKDIEFAWNQSSTQNQAIALGCTAAFANSKWTFTCPANKKKIDINEMKIGGGIAVDFAVNGATDVTYNFNKKLEMQWSTAQFGSGNFNFADAVITQGTTTFGSGTFNFGKLLTLNGTVSFGTGTFNASKGIVTGGGANATFGVGTFKIGQTEANNCNNARYSICMGGGSTLTFGGPSSFELTAGFYNSGNSQITFGSGTGNSFKIRAASNGNAVDLGGGSRTLMADASVFQVKGHVNGGGGGSCFVISAAAQHDIDGNFIASGAVLLGAGVYSVDGFFALGLGGGGNVTCNGQTFSVKGVDVSLILSGKTNATGNCAGYAFCIAAGYSGVQLTAPQTGALAKLAVAGPQLAARTGGASLTEGGSGAAISGAFYFPKGPIEMNGGSSMLGGGTADKCLQLIGSRITLKGGTSATSECIAATGATGTGSKISLVR